MLKIVSTSLLIVAEGPDGDAVFEAEEGQVPNE